MAAFSCDKCGKASTLKKNLYRHQRYSNGNPGYICKICKGVFLNKYNGVRHEAFCIEQPPCKIARYDNSKDVCPERHVQVLKKNCPEPTMVDLLKLISEEYETACQGRIKSYFLRSSEFEDLFTFLQSIKSHLQELVKLQLEEKRALKINIVVECLFENIVWERSDRAFKSRNKAVYLSTNLDEFLEGEFKKLVNEMEEAQLEKSGWQLIGIDGVRLRINQYKPLGCSTYIKLPNIIASKKACINPENQDKECFRYAVLAKFVERDPQRISKYKEVFVLPKIIDVCIRYDSVKVIHYSKSNT